MIETLGPPATIETVCVGGPYNGRKLTTGSDTFIAIVPTFGGMPPMESDDIVSGMEEGSTVYHLRMVILDFELVRWVYSYWCHESVIIEDTLLGSFHLSDCHVIRESRLFGLIVDSASMATLFDYGPLRMSRN